MWRIDGAITFAEILFGANTNTHIRKHTHRNQPECTSALHVIFLHTFILFFWSQRHVCGMMWCDANRKYGQPYFVYFSFCQSYHSHVFAFLGKNCDSRYNIAAYVHNMYYIYTLRERELIVRIFLHSLACFSNSFFNHLKIDRHQQKNVIYSTLTTESKRDASKTRANRKIYKQNKDKKN